MEFASLFSSLHRTPDAELDPNEDNNISIDFFRAVFLRTGKLQRSTGVLWFATKREE